MAANGRGLLKLTTKAEYIERRGRLVETVGKEIVFLIAQRNLFFKIFA